MKKALFFGLLLLLVVGGILAYNVRQGSGQAAPEAYSSKPAPWQPARLQIPRLQIDAPVLGVGATASGKMDAPTSQAINSPYWTSVFWYTLGVSPGQQGNAVIAGHVDKTGGDPAIFWNLKVLQPGDELQVQLGDASIVRFVVERLESYPAETTDAEVMKQVFGPTTERRLNLITCSGAWTEHGYDQRLVAFTRLASA
ncbi:sortase family protein [Thermosporothrix hazakensis]|jgi:hypothetical protein|uniref:Sortase family protein n=1 Tax=Thermosporothrix hazakensis TaxID=644383 RepID=A0A326UAZ7_THEHA|nr:class F sortase [Thermosporothrix hazakensis]PZW33022.1 sortase family protein [Thermosporothrix hazakensis]GCE49053.1 class F sortase [Thermosporothrix hazakensis]